MKLQLFRLAFAAALLALAQGCCSTPRSTTVEETTTRRTIEQKPVAAPDSTLKGK